MFTNQRGQSFQGGRGGKGRRGRGHQTDAESRQGVYNWTWMKLPTRCYLIIRISLVWAEGQTEVWLEPQGQLLSRGLQDTKTHWSAARRQDTTYSPEKADPPGTKCRKSPQSSHLTGSHSRVWGLITGQGCETFSLWAMLYFILSVLQVFFLTFYILTIQPASSGGSSGLFLIVIGGSDGSQVLQRNNGGKQLLYMNTNIL